MGHVWPKETEFRRVELVPEDRTCASCGSRMQLCDHRHRHIFTLLGPVHIVSKLAHCPRPDCALRHRTFSSPEELSLALPWWAVGWDVFAWVGQRRFARHWSIPQIRLELLDRYQIGLSDDTLEDYVQRYQTMVAARYQDPRVLAQEYKDVPDVVLAFDGLQPEKGHETLYVIREVRRRRVWFAEPLLSSAGPEVQAVLEKARAWAERLGKPVRACVSDKQAAFVQGVAAVFPGVPHRYCRNHFLRDLAPTGAGTGRAREGADAAQGPGAAGHRAGGAGGGRRACASRGRARARSGGRRARAWAGRRGGTQHVQAELQHVRCGAADVQQVAALLEGRAGKAEARRAQFEALQREFAADRSPFRPLMAAVMKSFLPGLFAGGDALDLPVDNLELECWFRQPKSHARRIHGRAHAGVRLVQEGPTLLPVLDAHLQHPAPFSFGELRDYAHASVPVSQVQACARRTLMRQARSKTARPLLLAALERPYQNTS